MIRSQTMIFESFFFVYKYVLVCATIIRISEDGAHLCTFAHVHSIDDLIFIFCLVLFSTLNLAQNITQAKANIELIFFRLIFGVLGGTQKLFVLFVKPFYVANNSEFLKMKCQCFNFPNRLRLLSQ